MEKMISMISKKTDGITYDWYVTVRLDNKFSIKASWSAERISAIENCLSVTDYEWEKDELGNTQYRWLTLVRCTLDKPEEIKTFVEKLLDTELQFSPNDTTLY